MRPAPLSAATAAVADTQALAAAIARLCRAGDVLVLAGELGAGKTAFAQGFAAGLGIAEQVTSPTFTIVREYPGPELALLHLDVYRLDQLREVQDLGVGEMLDEEAVMLVEWGDAVLPALGEEYLEIRITFGAADDDRILELHPSGSSWLARTRVLGEAVERWSTGGGDASC